MTCSLKSNLGYCHLKTHMIYQASIKSQMQLPSVMPILVLALVQYTWMKLAALEVRPNLLIVLESIVSTVDMGTQRMLV